MYFEVVDENNAHYGEILEFRSDVPWAQYDRRIYGTYRGIDTVGMFKSKQVKVIQEKYAKYKQY